MKMWKVTFGKNVDAIKVEGETIVEALGKARKWSDKHLPPEYEGEDAFSEEDREITEATLLFEDWLR